jgi:hypothetical protein
MPRYLVRVRSGSIFLKVPCDSDAVHKQLCFLVAIWQFAENRVAQSAAVGDLELFTARRRYKRCERRFVIAAIDHTEGWPLRIEHNGLRLRLRLNLSRLAVLTLT